VIETLFGWVSDSGSFLCGLKQKTSQLASRGSAEVPALDALPHLQEAEAR
jgi:hypothetical protein